MDFNVLKPTAENIKSTFEEDLLSRNKDVLRMISLLQNISGGTSIALDAQWGAGKTFFVKQVKMVLDAYNDHIVGIEDSGKDTIKSICGKHYTLGNIEPFVSVYYDAWENDNDIDPMLSIIYSIIAEANNDYSVKTDYDFVKIASGIFELVVGRDVKYLIESLRGEHPLERIKKSKDIREEIIRFFKALLPEHGNKLVVFIDELDRCRPSYAVQLLERIKHYFDCEELIFVFSVNIHELQYTIRHHYGEGFNASKYLDRFFDMTIVLPPPELRGYYQKIGLENGTWVFETICRRVVSVFHFELREIARFYSTAKVVAYKPAHEKSPVEFSEGKALQFSILCVVPVIIGLRINNHSEYESFIHGDDPTALLRVINSTEMAYALCDYLLYRDETYQKYGNDDTKKVVTLEEKLRQVYDALFIHDFDKDPSSVDIGSASFDKETKKEILRIASGLSNDMTFNI